MDYSGLDWGWGGGWVPGQGLRAVGSEPYDQQAMQQQVITTPSAQNIALLQSLGFGGNATNQTHNSYAEGDTSTHDVWSPEAMQWMGDHGISQGVGHLPNTSVSFGSGRPQFYGLLQDGKYMAGQSDPVLTQSDSIMDQITPFALMAGPMLSAVGTSMSGASAATGAAGAAGAGEAASSLGSLGGAADTGVTSLGSAWSPSNLGLTNLPAQTAIDYGAMTVPSLTPSIGDMALNGALKGGATGAVKGVATGQDPLKSAAYGAVGGALAGGIAGGVNTFNPGGSPIVNGAISGGITSGVTGGNPLQGAMSGGLSGAGSSLFSNSSTPTAPQGGNMDFGDLFSGSYTGMDPGSVTAGTGNWWDSLDGTGNVPSGNWLDSSGNYFNGTSSWLESLIGGGKNAVGAVVDALGGKQNAGMALGGLLGALGSQSQTQTQSRDPWSAAQPYLKNVLGDAEKLRQQYAANPFTPQQTQAYQNAFNGIGQAQNQLQGLLNFGSNAANGAFNYQLPSFQGLLSGRSPATYQGFGGTPPGFAVGEPPPSVGQPGPNVRLPTMNDRARGG